MFCLKTASGLPSYDLNQCPDGTLHPLVQASSSFGQADVSRLSQMALSRMATVYRKYRGVEGVGELELLLVAVELLSQKGVGDVELPLVAVVLLSPKGVELPLVAAVVEANEAAPHCGISVEMPFTTAVALSMMLTCCASPALRSS